MHILVCDDDAVFAAQRGRTERKPTGFCSYPQRMAGMEGAVRR